MINANIISVLMGGSSSSSSPQEILWGNEIYLMGNTSITFNN